MIETKVEPTQNPILKFKKSFDENLKILHRENESKQCLEILNRITNNSLMLVGAPGIGKTAFIKSFEDDSQIQIGKKIVNWNVHDTFQDIQQKAHFEQKVNSEIRNAVEQNYILFIDNFEP